MIRSLQFALVLLAAAVVTHAASGQESKAAKATREKLKQVIDEVDAKNVFTNVFFNDYMGPNSDLKNPLRFKFDAASGVSANTRLTFKAKKITVEKLLNDLSDQEGFGWIVISNAGNNKDDGAILIRKSTKGKERGYEAGKEPKEEKKSSSLEPGRDQFPFSARAVASMGMDFAQPRFVLARVSGSALTIDN